MKKKIIFFLGNGFSQGFCFPNLEELWNLSFEPSDECKDKGMGEDWDRLKKRYPVSRFLESGREIRDLELLLSVWHNHCEAYEAHVRVPHGNAYESGRIDMEHYVHNLFHRLLECTQKSSQLDKFSRFVQFLSQLSTCYDFQFATTNYDLVIERSLYEMDRKYAFLGEDNSAIPVRKLHGSIAWFCSGNEAPWRGDPKRIFRHEKDGRKLFVDDYSLFYMRGSSSVLCGKHIDESSQIQESDFHLATVIPPIVGKKYGPVFESAIGHFDNDVNQADCLCVIGYALSETDPVIRRLLIDASERLMKRGGRVIFINKDPKACERAKSLLGEHIEGPYTEPWSVNQLEKYYRTMSQRDKLES